MGDSALTLRDEALAVWEAGVAAVHGGAVVRSALEAWAPQGPVRLIALGKVAPFMARAALEVWGGFIEAGLVVGGEGYAPRGDWPDAVALRWGDHPLPGARSLAAGEALWSFTRGAPPPGGWLALLSGGASSLVERPAPGLTPADLRRAHRWLLGSGWPIDQVNAVRRRLSAIKGGGLLRRLAPGPVWAGYLSDVPGDRLPDLASGPLFPGQPPLPEGLPPWLADLCRAGRPVETPPVPVRHHLLGGLGQALRAAGSAARGGRRAVYLHRTPLSGEAEAVGRRLGRWLVEAAPPGVHLWGGETTVTLPAHPGRGGRNQTLALAAARELAGHPAVVLLAAGSDGVDGDSPHAGACVDGGTWARARSAGLDPEAALARADSAPCLAAAGDALPARVTATNVADLVVAIRG